MISELHIENFRSIEKATLDLGRITVLTGSNNSGKSSLMYGLACLKYLAFNPNRPLDAIFNLPNIINMGGFEDVIYGGKSNISKGIKLGVTLKDNNICLSNSVFLGEYQTKARLEIVSPFEASAELKFALPYSLNQTSFFDDKSKTFNGKYNGFSFSGLKKQEVNGHIQYLPVRSAESLLAEFVMQVDLIPVRRSFTKPYYAMVPLQVDIVTEDEMATNMVLNKSLVGEITTYLQVIAERELLISRVANSGIFYLQTRDIKTGLVNNLVNEGTGTNQLVTILSKVLQPNKKFICIDEPEIHLHPSMIEKLVEALVEIAYQENKQFLLSTHSEHFVTCLLSEVVKKKLQPDDLKVYYLTKNDKSTHIEYQKVYADGQLEGGLKNFYESELKNLETFFKIA